MKKVYYSIFKVGDFEHRYKGIAEINDEDLIVTFKNGNQRRYEDCLRYCHPIPGKPNEFKGTFGEWKEIEVPHKNGGTTTIEIEVTYNLWYKIIGA